MPNVFNTALNNTGQIGDGLIITSYDKALGWELTDLPVYRQVVKKFPMSPTNRGRVVNLKRFDYLPSGSRLIDEVISPDSMAAPETVEVNVTLNEYGAAVGRTWLLNQVEFTGLVDEAIAKALAKDAADTVDALVRDVLLTGTNRFSTDGTAVSSQAASALINTDVMSAAAVRQAVVRLRVRNAIPYSNDKYLAFIHPYVALDLRTESGASAWVWGQPVVENDPSRIWNGYVGTFEGAHFLETNRAPFSFDGAASSSDNHAVYRTLFCGQESLAEVCPKDIGTGLAPVVDKFNRHREIYWHAFMGHALYRDEVVQRVETGSSAGIVG